MAASFLNDVGRPFSIRPQPGAKAWPATAAQWSTRQSDLARIGTSWGNPVGVETTKTRFRGI